MRYLIFSLILLIGPGIAMAKGYTGYEVTHTAVYDKAYTSNITVLRRYHRGLFIDLEVFNARSEVFGGIGYQAGSANGVLDLRVNENNFKMFIMHRF